MMTFDHEHLQAYQLAVQVARWVRAVHWPRGEANLRDQARRASSSIALNIAEGRARGGAAERNHYKIAKGSAAEMSSVLDQIDLDGGTEMQRKLRSIASLLHVMSR